MSLELQTIPEIILDTLWLQDEAPDYGCEIVEPACSNEAVYRVRWGADSRVPVEVRCGCNRVNHTCLTCYDRTVVRVTQTDNVMTCAKCDRFMVPTSVDKIRSTR